MSAPIISVEGLGKRYRIRHQQEGHRYVALRDVLASKLSPRRWLATNGNGHHPRAAEDFWALKDVSFDVQQGEVVGIIGRNGAGKSTLLKILSRITEPTEGRVTLRGRVASLLEVGTGFHPELTGRENIFLNGAILGMSRVEIVRKFDEIVAFAEVEKFLDTPVKRYSSGMYVRLAFAVAAHLDPEILVVDEVLAVGDVTFQSKCLGKMREVSEGGRTVLFVSHNMAAVKTLTRRAVWIDSGALRLDGVPSNVIRCYLQDSQHSTGNPPERVERYRRNQATRPTVRLTRIAVEANECPPTLDMQDTLALIIEFESDIDVRGGMIDFELKKADGERVTVVASLDSGFRVHATRGRHLVRCHVRHLGLTPARYLIDVGISESPGSVAWDVILNYPLFTVADRAAVLDWSNRPWAAVHCSDVTWQLMPSHPASETRGNLLAAGI